MAVTAATSLISGKMQADAAKDAGKMQADSADRATALQYEQYQQQRADQEPWRQAGIGALSGMQNADFQRDFTASDFQKDPGYDFRMQQGQQALERSAAARGGLQSGGTLKALSRYGQDYASNEYNNAYNRFNSDRDRRFGRLSSIAGFGQNATNQLGNYSMNYANQAGQSIMGAGNALAAGRLGEGQAWGNAWTNVGKAYQDNQKMIVETGGKLAGGMMGGA